MLLTVTTAPCGTTSPAPIATSSVTHHVPWVQQIGTSFNTVQATCGDVLYLNWIGNFGVTEIPQWKGAAEWLAPQPAID